MATCKEYIALLEEGFVQAEELTQRTCRNEEIKKVVLEVMERKVEQLEAEYGLLKEDVEDQRSEIHRMDAARSQYERERPSTENVHNEIRACEEKETEHKPTCEQQRRTPDPMDQPHNEDYRTETEVQQSVFRAVRRSRLVKHACAVIAWIRNQLRKLTPSKTQTLPLNVMTLHILNTSYLPLGSPTGDCFFCYIYIYIYIFHVLSLQHTTICAHYQFKLWPCLCSCSVSQTYVTYHGFHFAPGKCTRIQEAETRVQGRMK
jgi:hypothetical protein